MYKADVATDEELKDWNRTISHCQYSEALHTMEWRDALATCFKQLEPIYFVIRDNSNCIAGAFPCFVFRPIPLCKMLLSMPWTLPGGPLIFPEANFAEAILAIIKKLDEISHEQHSFETALTLTTDYSYDISSILATAGYLKSSNHFTHILDTSKGYDAVREAYNKRIRGAVRKSQKVGVIVQETEDEVEMMAFYRLYLASMERFKSTPKPYQLLRYLQKSQIARLVVARLDNQVIGGLLFLYFNSSVRLWCEASDPNFLSYRPNNAAIDYIIQWACKRGYPRVDFGASPSESEGLIAFKEEWRAKKVWFYTFTRLCSSRRKRLWTVSEPALRRLYGAIQRFRLWSI